MTKTTRQRKHLSSIPLFAGVLSLLVGFGPAPLQGIEYTGGVNATWSEGGNWDGGTAPGTGETADFIDGGNGNTTLSLNGITITHLNFNGGAVAAYTLGSGGVGAETFSLDGAGANNLGIVVENSVTNDITIDANINLIGDTKQYRFRNLSTNADLIINGVIDNVSSGAGSQQLTFGNFAPSASKVILNGNVLSSGTSSLTMSLFGRSLDINADASAVASIFIRDGGVLTTGASGVITNGVLNLAHGTVNLNNTSSAQALTQISLGNDTTGNGDAFLNIANGATVDLNGGGIRYFNDDGTANQATISGGNLQITGANRTITIDDNVPVTGAELTINSNITDDGVANRTVTVQGLGTLSLGGDATIDRVNIQNAKTVLTTGTAFGTGRVFVNQTNNGSHNYDVVLDINGQSVDIGENLVVSSFSTNSQTAGNQRSTRIIDSADNGTSALNLGNQIVFNIGNGGAGKTNVTAFIEADINLNGASRLFNVQDGVSDVDLDISGTIFDDNGGGRSLTKAGTGTLKLSASDNLYDGLFIDGGTVQITDVGALGDNIISLGNGTTDGTLEYLGSGGEIGTGSLFHQVRIGQNDADTATGIILNNGTGGLNFVEASFNQVRGGATVNRILTLGGDNTGGDNIIAGIIANNENTNATVGINKTGSNTWVLNGANTFTGATTVTTGRLDIGGTNMSSISVASGATLGGEGSTTGSITLADGSIISGVDGSTAAALTTTDGTTGLDLTGVSANGITVNIDNGGPGDFTVIDYGGIATGFTAGSGAGLFMIGTAPAASGRGGGGLMDTGTVITFNLGFETRTWQVGGSSNWVNGNTVDNNWVEGDNDYFDGDAVIFTNSDLNASAPATAQVVTLTGNVSPSSVTFSNNDASYTINDNGGGEAITGTGAVIKSGSAAVTINNANSYSGGTTIGQGVLTVTNSAALGTGTVTINDDGTTPDLTLGASGLNIANDIVFSAAGTRKDVSFDPTGGADTAEISGNIAINETSDWATQFFIGSGDVLTLSGIISGVGNPRLRSAGKLLLTNDNNSFDDPLYIDLGTIEVTSIADKGVSSAAGAGLAGAGSVDIRLGFGDSTGTFSYIGSGSTTNRRIQVGITNGNLPDDTAQFASARIESNGTNGGTGLVFTNPDFNVADANAQGKVRARTLSLGGTNTDANEIQGVIIDNAGSGGAGGSINTINLVKDGVGSWALSGTNTYSGTTTVSEGTLFINGDNSGAAGIVTVASGATLGGSGTIGGATDISGTHTAGTTTGAGTQTFSNGLTYNDGSTITWNLINTATTPGTDWDLFDVTSGTLDFNDGVDGSRTFTIDDDSSFDYTSIAPNMTTDFLVWQASSVVGFDGNDYSIFYDGSNNLNGGSFMLAETSSGVVLRFTAIPEPSTFTLMGFALAGFGWAMRRRKRREES